MSCWRKLQRILCTFTMPVGRVPLWRIWIWPYLTSPCSKSWFSRIFFCDFQDEILSAHLQHQQAIVHPLCVTANVMGVTRISKNPSSSSRMTGSIICMLYTFIRPSIIIISPKSEVWTSTDILSTQMSAVPNTNQNMLSWIFGVPVRTLAAPSSATTSLPTMEKGAADGESAVVKSSARNAVKSSRHIISNAEELFTNCMGNLTRPVSDDCSSHFWRTFFWILKGRCGQKLSEKHWP